MDPHVRWMRRHLASTVAHRLAWEASTVALAVAGGALLTGLGVALAVPWGFVAAHLFAIARVTLALRTGAFARQRVEAYLDRRLIFRAEDIATDDDLSQLLLRRDLEPVSRLRARPGSTNGGEDDPTVDVFQSANRLTTVLRGRGGSVFPAESLRLATRLIDGRCLVTTGQAIPAHSSLFINYNPGALPTALLDSHIRAVRAVAERGLRPVTTGPELAVDLLITEQTSLAELGPMLAPFLAPGRRASLLGLTVSVPPAELRRLGLTVPVPTPTRPSRPATASNAA